MAITPIGSLAPYGGPVLRSEIVANSVVITVHDSVKISSGFVALGTTGASVFGHVTGIVANTGVGLSSSGAAGAQLGSFLGTATMASDNQTVAKNRAMIDVSQFTMYSGEVDAAIGTTTGSNLLGYRMDLTDEDTLDESTAATTSAQYAVWGVDPRNSAQAVVTILESSVFNT